MTQLTTLQITVVGFMMSEVSIMALYNTAASCRICTLAAHVSGIAGGMVTIETVS